MSAEIAPVVTFVVNKCDIATTQWNGTHLLSSGPSKAYLKI
jgi:hypothetical protein